MAHSRQSNELVDIPFTLRYRQTNQLANSSGSGKGFRHLAPRPILREKNLKYTAAIILCGLVSITYLDGCAAQKQWAATGGSRADGTVELAFEYGEFEKPEIDEQQGVDLAAARCGRWGYTGSEPFGSAMNKCEMVGGYGNCLRWLVTRTYQCTGAPASSNAPQTAAVPSPAGNAARTAQSQNVQQAAAPVAANAPQSPTAGMTTSASPSTSAPPSVVNPNTPTNKPPSFENF